MIKKNILIIVLIVLISTILTPEYVLASRSVDVILSTDDLVVSEGDDATLEIKFTNNTGSSVGITSYSVNGHAPVSITTDNICNSPGSFFITINHTVNFGPNTQADVYVEVTYSGTGIMNPRTVRSNTIVFEKAESVNSALVFTVTTDTISVECGGEVTYNIAIKNNGNVDYDNFDIVLNGSVIKTYSLLPMGNEITFTSTQGYYSDKTDKFGYRYDYTYRGVTGQIEDANAQQYLITVSSTSATASPTSSPIPTPTTEVESSESSINESITESDKEQYISIDSNATIELIVNKPNYGFQVGDSIGIVIVVKNTGNRLLKDVLLSVQGTDELREWDRITPNTQKRYVDTVTVQLDRVDIYNVIATDINGNKIEVVSEPIVFNLINENANEPYSDNIIVEGLKSEYRYLITIVIVLVAVTIAIIVIYLYKKKSMNQMIVKKDKEL